jgi:hypothetical protein
MKSISFSFALLTSTLAVSAAEGADPRLVGVWSTLTYVIEGKEHPMDGIFIFTEKHFAANAYFRISGGDMDDANANAGTYATEGNKLVFQQQVQIHIRPGDAGEPLFYGKGVEEAATYLIEGNHLTITFPSGNLYRCEKIE